MLGTLLGFSALSVDIGMIRVSVTQLQAAVDAAALSGAAELDGTDGGISRAVSRAQEIAALNPVLDQVLAVPSADIQIGTWDADSGTFTLYNAGDDPSTVNAVIVDHTPPQIGSALGQLAFGLAGYNIQARSTAMRPTGGKARSTKCFLPLAIPDCWLAGLPPGTNPPPFKFTFSPSPTDKIAWGDPDGNPNSNDIRDQLLGQCDHGAIEVGDPIYVNEGSHTSALQTIRDILNDVAPVDPDVWDTSVYGAQPLRLGTADTANTPVQSSVTAANWGHTLEGPVALVNAGTN
ncbi:MAG TPA: pilus assembly protein TadG-related protein, partial [Gemmatimonadaceae bacterium]|nr:pilus assembly protein TadG-related protein [Gemmatimonadaceae bacterium]